MSDARFWKYYTFNIQSEGLLMLINSLQYFDQISWILFIHMTNSDLFDFNFTHIWSHL